MRSLSTSMPAVTQRTSDANKYRNEDRDVIEQRCFYGGYSYVAAASNYPHIQLVNPAGSGKVILLDAIIANTDANGNILVGTLGSNLANDVAAWSSKFIDAADGVGLIKYEDDTSVKITALSQFKATNIKEPRWVITRPFLIGQGRDIVISVPTVTMELTVHFEGREL